MGATFLVCHGAWSAGWAWKKLHPLMSAAGHRLVTPTYTGLGEREHLANPSIDLETHIHDILNVIKYEDLRDIVLIGHSYGGMVATGVADRARDRVVQLIYLDAFVPKDGQSLLDLNEPARQRMLELAKSGDGWRVPPNPTPPDTSQADLEWLTERRVFQPIKCFEMPLKLRGGELTLPRSYIYATRATAADTFRPFAERVKSEAGWRYHELDASHSPNVTAPEALMALLEKIVAERPYSWVGVRRVAPNPSSLEYQPACKPGFVGHRLLAQTIRDGHSSGTTFARCLEQPTRTASLTSPCGVIAFANIPALPSLFGFAPGVVCHAVSVAGYAVRSYRTFSPLLPLPFGWGKRFVLCGTFPGVAPAGCYPAPYVDGARTFLPRSLSTVAGAAVRPTDA